MDALDTLLRENSALRNCVRRRGFMRHHHVSVILSCKTNNVLCYSSNIMTPFPCKSVHAEAAAIAVLQDRIRARQIHLKDLRKGVSLLSLRIAPAGHLLYARPCAACTACIAQTRIIRRVGWSTDAGTIICSTAGQKNVPTHSKNLTCNDCRNSTPSIK